MTSCPDAPVEDMKADKRPSVAIANLTLLWHILLTPVIFGIPESAFD
jgi:hypothetical protein